MGLDPPRRFRDNVYILLVAVPEGLTKTTLDVVGALIDVLYAVPMKWEPVVERTTWCECSFLVTSGGGSLRRKGAVDTIPKTLDLKGTEWETWLPRVAPNTGAVMKALLPSLALKSVWYAFGVPDLIVNFRSIFWGVGWMGYPVSWWGNCLRRCIDHYDLGLILTSKLCSLWVREGRAGAATAYANAS